MLPRRTAAAWLAAGVLCLVAGISIAARGGAASPLFELSRFSEADRKALEFLVLLPAAATIICFVRVVIGLPTFGTFAPALLGLAFRELESPAAAFALAGILFAGWFLRGAADYFHLLQVPRASLLLSCTVLLLIGYIALGERLHIPSHRVVPLFPLIILTGMTERFWSVGEESGTAATFRTLIATAVVCGGIALLLRGPGPAETFVAYPEGIGFLMAIQLVLGRYTGYRLLELYRFRSLSEERA